MAIDSIKQKQYFKGLSSDTKPKQNVPALSEFIETDTGDIYVYTDTSWIKKSTGGAALVNVSNTLISYVWAGAGTTSAPNPTAFPDFVVGVNQGGGATGNVYHVINGAWVDTGATVKNLYGGA